MYYCYTQLQVELSTMLGPLKLDKNCISVRMITCTVSVSHQSRSKYYYYMTCTHLTCLHELKLNVMYRHCVLYCYMYVYLCKKQNYVTVLYSDMFTYTYCMSFIMIQYCHLYNGSVVCELRDYRCHSVLDGYDKHLLLLRPTTEVIIITIVTVVASDTVIPRVCYPTY